MTPAILLETFRSRGVQLEAQGSRLHYVGSVSVEDLTLLREHKADLLAVLRAEHQPTSTTSDDHWADDVSAGPCGLCGHQPLGEVQDWPTAGERRWVCLRCAARPVPTLAAVHAGLTDAERRQLCTEADDGDFLARRLLGMLAEGTA